MRYIVSLLLVISASSGFARSQASISYETGKPDRLLVTGLDARALAALQKLDAAAWGGVISVVVVAGTEEETAHRPAVLGDWKIDGKRLIFEPRFGLSEGVEYRVLLNSVKLLDSADPGKFLPVGAAAIPKKDRPPSAKVMAVYPSTDRLPENQLKFYVHFSAAMARGEVYRRVQLLNEAGKPVEGAFIEIDEELWDRAGRRITLLLDPGRVKRGLVPRQGKGPILEEGKTYTLVVSSAWRDAEGAPLRDGFRKTFKVTAPELSAPDPKTWKLAAPAAGEKGAVELRFPRPLDHALLQRVLWVVDADGKTIPGSVAVGDEEKLWRFTPEQAWSAGAYKIVVETILEDLAANGVGKPFEVEGHGKAPRTNENKTVELPFRVR